MKVILFSFKKEKKKHASSEETILGKNCLKERVIKPVAYCSKKDGHVVCIM